MSRPTISVLVAARKNSKYLMKFLMGYLMRTHDFANTEILVMTNKEDTWNAEAVAFFSQEIFARSNIRFFDEDLKLGRAGLHTYFNTMLPHARGEWVVYFCEDHFIILDDWDSYVREFIIDRDLDPRMVYCLVPRFDNVGAMNHVLSRGYIEALNGVIGRHGWIDSYINDLFVHLSRERLFRFDREMFHDFTHDVPSPMSDAHLQSITAGEGVKLPTYKSVEVSESLARDVWLINEAIKDGK